MELLDHGYEVLAIVHDPERTGALKELSGKLEIVSCDVADLNEIARSLGNGYDFFFHMAWGGVSGRLNSDLQAQMRNINGAVTAVRVAKRLGCNRFIGAGSLHEIECKREMEQPHPAYNRANYYKTAKLAAHYFAKLEATQQDIEFLWPRLTNTYGAGEVSARLINSTIRKLLSGESPALTKGEQLYTFLYITDVARSYRLIAERGKSFQSYIIGNDEILPLKEYLCRLQKIVNPDVKLGFGKHEFSGVSLERSDLYSPEFFKDIQFKAEISFEEGIKRTKEFIQHQMSGI